MSGKKGHNIAPGLPGKYEDRYKRSRLGWPEFYKQQLLSESDRTTLLFALTQEKEYEESPEKYEASLEILSFGSGKEGLIFYLDALYANPDMRKTESVDNWLATQSLMADTLEREIQLDLKSSPIIKIPQKLSRAAVRAEFIKEEYMNWLAEFLRDPATNGSDIAAELARVFQVVSRQGISGIARALADKSSPFFLIVRTLHDAAQAKMQEFSTSDAYVRDVVAFSIASAVMTIEQRAAFCEYYSYITPELGKSELQTLIVAETQRVNDYAKSEFASFIQEQDDAKLPVLIDLLITNYQLLDQSREQIKAGNKDAILECAVCVEQIRWLKGQVKKALTQQQTMDLKDLEQIDFAGKMFNFAEGRAFFDALVKKLTPDPGPSFGTGLRLEV